MTEPTSPAKRARLALVDEPAPTVLAAMEGWSDIAPTQKRPSRSQSRAGRSGASSSRRRPQRRSGTLRDASAVEVPPYAVPLLSEIAELPTNGLRVASTFAGAGGSSTGWAIAGYRVAWACEFHPPAAESYAANHPDTVLDRRDVRTVTGAEIVEACGGVAPDVLDGSPPCQDFSMAGKRTRGWGEERQHGDGTHQRSDDLFGQYIRLVDELRPRAFVAENVRGLVAGAAKGQFKRIMADLTGCGYRVRAKVLDAQWLGVPQRRRRVIIIGVRDDLGAEPTFPTPLPYRYSMLDACPWLASFDTLRGGHGFSDETQTIDVPAPTIGATSEGAGRWEVRNTRNGHNYGETIRDANEPAATVRASDAGRLSLHYREGTPRYMSGRSEPLDGPISSVTTQGAQGMRHSELSIGEGTERRLTIAEVKRLCSFPDDYVLTGTYSDQWARLGNSVPPLMMAAVARSLASVLLGATG